MAYRVQIAPSALKALRSLANEARLRLVHAIDALASDLRRIGCKRLMGRPDTYRVRAGDYRVIYRVEDRQLLVLVLALGHRREIYRG